MSGHLKRVYDKEEGFLDEFPGIAKSASQLLDGDWEPNCWCNDKTRRNTKYLLSRGELQKLTFDSASVHHDNKGFSSAQIVLKSSDRIVTVVVKKMDGDFVAEKIGEQKKLPLE